MGWGSDIWGFAKKAHDPRSMGGLVDTNADEAAQARQDQFLQVDEKGRLGREASRAGAFANHGQNEFKRQGHGMDALADTFRRQINGQNSLASEQFRQQLGQQQAQFQSMAAGARPGNQAMAARQAMLGMGRAGSATSGQAALAGIQERNMAAQQLGGLLGTQRQQDLSAALGSRGLAIQGLGDIESARSSRFTGTMPGQAGPTEKEQQMGIAGGILQGIAAISDERLKTDIADGDDDAKAFLDGLKAYRFRYKDGKHGDGEQLGIMAQDLEKTRLGKQAVIDTPKGKMVGAAKLATALAAASVNLNKRLSKLESK